MTIKDEAEALKDWADVGENYWFAPKLFGWGATPVTWQGWALCAVMAVALWLEIRFLPTDVERWVAGAATLLLFCVIAWRKTPGGWRWHWGLPKK
jgi:hypothetical protein